MEEGRRKGQDEIGERREERRGEERRREGEKRGRDSRQGVILEAYDNIEHNTITRTYRASATYIPHAMPLGESTMSKLLVMKMPAADPLQETVEERVRIREGRARIGGKDRTMRYMKEMNREVHAQRRQG